MHASTKEHASSLEARQQYTEFLIALQDDAARAFENGNKEAQIILARYLADMQKSFSLETEKMVQAWTETESRVDLLNRVRSRIIMN